MLVNQPECFQCGVSGKRVTRTRNARNTDVGTDFQRFFQNGDALFGRNHLGGNTRTVFGVVQNPVAKPATNIASGAHRQVNPSCGGVAFGKNK